ncbi:unannotated protein [freshwater metagenome]|uniref:Unannotated protein n=1 Tax=freshwater metagenome TaxID=449393 RepID=A0A6J7L3V7_9ZZZZ
MVADNLGQRTAARRNQRNTAAHGFNCRKREALVERRNNGYLSFGIELNDSFFGDASNKGDGIAKTKFVDDPSRWAAFFQTTDDDKLNMAFGAELGNGLEEITKAFHRYVGACCRDQATRDTGNAGNGLEQFLIHTNRYDVQSIKRDFLIGVDIGE